MLKYAKKMVLEGEKTKLCKRKFLKKKIIINIELFESYELIKCGMEKFFEFRDLI
jgi:hypothetical protein